jgi:hypothetical protein
VTAEGGKALEGATLQLVRLSPGSAAQTASTDKEGTFVFPGLSFDYYRLQISFVGFQPLTVDSIFLRPERPEFHLSGLELKPGGAGSQLGEVVVHVEKPLVQMKEGNVTFNAAESPLAAGGSASDLLATVPLVSKDADGKVTVRGKEPKILIDGKPMELNLQQLQDLLESMPGSSIEKIEVLTNPPPQYANEPGGVINIVLKKGRVGKSGRLNVFYGTRGEQGANGSFNYRKSGLVININGGVSANAFEGYGYSVRENRYADSTNAFRTRNNYRNRDFRPNLRASVEYDFNPHHALSLTGQFNSGRQENTGFTRYENTDRFDQLYRLSTRDLDGDATNRYAGWNLNYTFRSKKAGEVLRVFTDGDFSTRDHERAFLQTFLTPGLQFINDSLRTQRNDDRNRSFNVRVHYDLPLTQTTYLSLGTFRNAFVSHQVLDAAFRRQPEGTMQRSETLSNDFRYRQTISSARASLRRNFSKTLNATAGLAVERTAFGFDLYKTDSAVNNHYVNYLPFFNMNKTWKEVWNLRLAYRKSIRRPGIGELNPSVDYTDPFNIRFGNPDLDPSTAHHFDLVVGKSNRNFHANIGVGYNQVEAVFSQLRTPVSDSKTEITWQNISGRKEYEVHSWNGYTFSRKLRVNFNAGYTYNRYGTYDRTVRKFRNGGSFTSNLNSQITFTDALNTTANFTFNRFANPQGTVRGSLSFNMGIQAKWFQKKFVTTLNLIDPFNQQEYRNLIFGPNFSQENFNTTRTRNFRLSLSYHFSQVPSRPQGKKIDKKQLQDLMKK